MQEAPGVAGAAGAVGTGSQAPGRRARAARGLHGAVPVTPAPGTSPLRQAVPCHGPGTGATEFEPSPWKPQPGHSTLRFVASLAPHEKVADGGVPVPAGRGPWALPGAHAETSHGSGRGPFLMPQAQSGRRGREPRGPEGLAGSVPSGPARTGGTRGVRWEGRGAEAFSPQPVGPCRAWRPRPVAPLGALWSSWAELGAATHPPR